MHRIGVFAVLLFSGFRIEAFETKPWFYSLFDFQAKAEYAFQYFPSVDNGINPAHYSSSNNFVRLGILLPFLPTWEAEAELELNSTRKYSFSFESFGLAARKQILSDIVGDPVSLAVGGSLILTSGQRLFDVVTPYHNLANFELGVSVGKEFSDQTDWYARVYGYGALGQANRGSPWIKLLLKGQTKFYENYLFSAFLDGYFGLGNRKVVNIALFDSYARISHRSVDLGVAMSYLFDIWGKLTAQYAFRVYAASYPRYAGTVTLSYQLPWSI